MKYGVFVKTHLSNTRLPQVKKRAPKVQEDDDIRIEICSFNIPLKKVLRIQDVYELRKYVERNNWKFYKNFIKIY